MTTNRIQIPWWCRLLIFIISILIITTVLVLTSPKPSTTTTIPVPTPPSLIISEPPTTIVEENLIRDAIIGCFKISPENPKTYGESLPEDFYDLINSNIVDYLIKKIVKMCYNKEIDMSEYYNELFKTYNILYQSDANNILIFSIIRDDTLDLFLRRKSFSSYIIPNILIGLTGYFLYSDEYLEINKSIETNIKEESKIIGDEYNLKLLQDFSVSKIGDKVKITDIEDTVMKIMNIQYFIDNTDVFFNGDENLVIYNFDFEKFDIKSFLSAN
jgi:hypothetical protein